MGATAGLPRSPWSLMVNGVCCNSPGGLAAVAPLLQGQVPISGALAGSPRRQKRSICAACRDHRAATEQQGWMSLPSPASATMAPTSRSKLPPGRALVQSWSKETMVATAPMVTTGSTAATVPMEPMVGLPCLRSSAMASVACCNCKTGPAAAAAHQAARATTSERAA